MSLALKSLRSRWFSSLLTVVLIAFSVGLVLSVERTREAAKESFQTTLSDVDLIVGARGGSLQLLLYSVFRLGSATNNLSWESFERITQKPDVAFAIPISLGDSYRGFRVIGTDDRYFKHYRFRGGQSFKFQEGQRFQDLYEVVLGSQVAEQLNHQLGDRVVIQHGVGEASFEGTAHDDYPFRVVGILEPTGTPVDQSVHISLESLKAIHVNWNVDESEHKDPRKVDLSPTQITAAFIGLHSKLGIFRLQREVNTYEEEPLMAILPGIEFQNLWSTFSIAETALLFVSFSVILVSLLSMMMNLFLSVRLRRREIAILRSVGAKPVQVFGMIVGEAFILTLAGILLGLFLFYITMSFLGAWALSELGLLFSLGALSKIELLFIGVILVASLIVSSLPAWNAYRQSLSDGLNIKL